MKLLVYLILVIVFGFSFSNHSQEKETNNKYKTWISSETVDDDLSVTAYFENNTGKDIYISYLLESNKSGISGKSNTSQKGSVEVKSRTTSVLSSVKINVNDNDSYKFKLRTILNNEVVGSDSVIYNLK